MVAQLDDEVVIAEAARRQGRRQTPHAGPGRPTLSRCPGCDQEMPIAKLRDHRMPCIRERIESMRYQQVQLFPKDPDPYPNFMVKRVDDSGVEFEKLSSKQSLRIELRKIAEIVAGSDDRPTYIRVLGRVHWDGLSTTWQFIPSRLGRPPMVRRRQPRGA